MPVFVTPAKNPSLSSLHGSTVVPTVYAASETKCIFIQKSLAMGCSVYIVETIERHKADENKSHHTQKTL